MAAADVVLCPTVQSLSHTAARKAATEAGARIATLPGRDRGDARAGDVGRHGGPAPQGRRDRRRADRRRRGADHLPRNGSDLRLGLGDREAIPDAGDLTAPGAFGNLPCGEGFIAPIEGTAEGTLVVDGTIASIGRVVRAGRADGRGRAPGRRHRRRGRAAARAAAHPRRRAGTNVAELGIGTNEKAQLTGELLEDEKILGTCHVAFGASAAIGGTVQVPVHLDCVVLEPDVSVDGEPLVRAGELLVG